MTARDTRGRPVDLAALRGDWVILAFWGGACDACWPALDALADIARRNPVQIVVVGQAPRGAVESGAARPDWPVVDDADGVIRARFGVHVVPSYVLVDRKGLLLCTSCSLGKLRRLARHF